MEETVILKHFSGVSGVDAFFFRNFSTSSVKCRCRECEACDYINTHRYGAYEAQRLEGKYIYYCRLGFIFISVVVNDGSDACVAGPITSEGDDFHELDSLDVHDERRITAMNAPCLNAERLESCVELLRILFHKNDCAKDSPQNGISSIVDEIKITANYTYPIELEKKLRSSIIAGEEENSKEYLNILLGHIFFSSNADFEIIKHRAMELIVLLSRAAIDRGADIQQILMLNTDYFLSIEKFRTLDELNEWLSRIINRFIGYVFELADVKHTDILHKAVRYIKEHYSEKITLDIICREVSLSRAYLSKIFNSEMNCSITQYVNRVRVEKSKKLLLDKRINIVDVANMVGFGDQSYYTKVFKRVEGISPGKYRETGGEATN